MREIVESATYAIIFASVFMTLINVLGMVTNANPPSTRVWLSFYGGLVVLFFLALLYSAP